MGAEREDETIETMDWRGFKRRRASWGILTGRRGVKRERKERKEEKEKRRKKRKVVQGEEKKGGKWPGPVGLLHAVLPYVT